MTTPQEQHAVITVIGQDRVGIISAVSALLASHQINIKDISQTIMQEVFTMVMLVDITRMDIAFSELAARLESVGAGLELTIRIQHVGIFNAMHRI
ncbi:MAG: ACT domain-containing protein [Clostridiaceae bacterium]|jgi:ACT domain-containing protein|nr:ACT domain-containing protein [Clostridiaceae bacterium]